MLNRDQITQYLEYSNDITKFAQGCINSTQPQLEKTHKEILNSFLRDHYLCVLKTEHTNLTIQLKIIVAYISIFCRDCSIGILTQDHNFLHDVYNIIEEMPYWFRPTYLGVYKNSCTFENRCRLYLTDSNSNLIISNPHMMFHAVSLNVLLVDNAAHIDNLDEIVNNINPVLSSTSVRSKELGIPYGAIYGSTLNTKNTDNYFNRLWMDSKYGKSIFKPIKFQYK